LFLYIGFKCKNNKKNNCWAGIGEEVEVGVTCLWEELGLVQFFFFFDFSFIFSISISISFLVLVSWFPVFVFVLLLQMEKKKKKTVGQELARK